MKDPTAPSDTAQAAGELHAQRRAIAVWHVRVTFIEPTFDLFVGRESATRFWTWEGTALTPTAARCRAVTEFKRLSVESSVGWVRDIQGVSVELHRQATDSGWLQ